MDVKPYVEGYRRRVAERLARRDALMREAWSQIDAMHGEFAEPPRPQRVRVFGSLVKERFLERSDVDIAVEGLDEEQARQLRRRLQAHATHEVDLIRFDEIDEALRDIIRMYGKVIYEPD